MILDCSSLGDGAPSYLSLVRTRCRTTPKNYLGTIAPLPNCQSLLVRWIRIVIIRSMTLVSRKGTNFHRTVAITSLSAGPPSYPSFQSGYLIPASKAVCSPNTHRGRKLDIALRRSQEAISGILRFGPSSSFGRLVQNRHRPSSVLPLPASPEDTIVLQACFPSTL